MSCDPVEKLCHRYDALLSRLGAAKGIGNFGDLAARYAEPQRRDHPLDHIVRCLAELDQARHLTDSPDEVEAALFFHDAVYDSKADDNEERSACLAEEVLTAAGVDASICGRVADLIRATTHRTPPDDPDAMLVVDVDLAGLADPIDDFLETGRRIREEYPHVPDVAFVEGRREFFRAFLARKSIYATKYFRERLEDAARENLRSLMRDDEPEESR